jgi:predicted nuclease of restriction endonuclease-like RecB superfamily
MELASLDKVLFGYKGPDFSIRDRAYLFYVGFWGNARYRPKHFAKLSAYASS